MRKSVLIPLVLVGTAILAAAAVFVAFVALGVVGLGPFAPPAPASTSASPSDEPGSVSPVTEEDDDFGTVEVYSVLADGSLDPQPTGLTATVWETFRRVATPDFAAEVMVQFRVGDAPSSDTLAYVYQDSDPQYWILADNLATSTVPADLIATLIHEYGHIITLGLDEVDPSVTDCPRLQLDEGCAKSDSIIQQFQSRFWADYTDAPDATNSDGDAAYQFYLDHEEDFVSDYAATNVVEDLAESFMTFVLEDEPTGSTVAAQKLEFFWSFPEYVAIRERIRAEFASELGLPN